MANEAVTQEQFHELQGQFHELQGQFHELKELVELKFDKLEDSMNKLRTWTVSAFFGAVVVIGTLIGAYAMFLIRLQ